MSETIYLKTGQFSSRSFNASKKELKQAADALNLLDDHGAMSNTTYNCDGISRPIFSVDVINEASSIANLVNSLYEKLEAYSSLLQSGSDALHDADSSFKGEYTNAWQRGWYSVSSGVSSVYNNTVSFWGSLFRKDGKKTGSITATDDRSENGGTPDDNSGNQKESQKETAEEQVDFEQQAVRSEYSSKVETELEDIIDNHLGDGPYTYWSWYYGMPSSRTDGWCATFVSYIMDKSGIDVDSPLESVEWFKTYPPHQATYLESVGCYYRKETGYAPKTGDLVFFDNLENDGAIDHVGMIYVDEDGTVYVIHGNWGDKVTKSKLYEDYANSSQRLVDCVTGYGDIDKLAQIQMQ